MQSLESGGSEVDEQADGSIVSARHLHPRRHQALVGPSACSASPRERTHDRQCHASSSRGAKSLENHPHESTKTRSCLIRKISAIRSISDNAILFRQRDITSRRVAHHERGHSKAERQRRRGDWGGAWDGSCPRVRAARRDAISRSSTWPERIARTSCPDSHRGRRSGKCLARCRTTCRRP